MKKIATPVFLLFCTLSLFAKTEFRAIPTVGYGQLFGSRMFAEDTDSYVGLAANGIEAGITLELEFDGCDSVGFGCEAYFGYLFALNGGESLSTETFPTPTAIGGDLRYTDYKAGLGLTFRHDMLRLACGIDFAGISDHYMEDGGEAEGRKVTSFGVYGRLGLEIPVTGRISLVPEIHCCLNTAGWIRTFNREKGGWDNHFESADIRLVSAFVKLGVRIGCGSFGTVVE